MMGTFIYSPTSLPYHLLIIKYTESGEALKRRNNDLCSSAGGGGGGGSGTLRRGAARSTPCNVDDLIHLAGPLTEDAVLKTLQARFYADEFFVRFYEENLYFIFRSQKPRRNNKS